MRLLTLAGVILALTIPTLARAQTNGATVPAAGNVCPTSAVLNVGNSRPLIETQYGQLCIQGNVTSTLTGSATNGANGQPSSSTNIPTVANVYGYNGATNDPIGVDGANNLQVTPIGVKVFYDGFETSFDTTTRWNAGVSAGGGVGEAWSAGQITLGTGTTANGYAYVQSRPAFQPVPPGWNVFEDAIKFSASIPLNAEAFWGFGTSPATPTAAIPITEGCGFEISASTQHLLAVCFAGSTRNTITDLTTAGTAPTDGATHVYKLFFRGDYYWYVIDGKIVAKQTTGANGPNVNTQPLSIAVNAGTTNPLSSLTLTVASVWVGNTTGGATQICDATNPWQCAAINSSGQISVLNAGTSSNASSGVATSATNVPTVSYNYGWNGTTWDQLKTAPGITTTGVGLLGTGIASVYNSTLPTYTTGQYGMSQMSAHGALIVQGTTYDGTAGSDAQGALEGFLRPDLTTSAATTPVATGNYNFNGTTWDRGRSILGAVAVGTGNTAVDIAPTSAAPAAIVPSISASSAATSLIAKASAGNFYDAYCQSTAAGRCIIYNSTTAPGAGALTAALVLDCAVVPAGGQGSVQYGDIPRRASTGITVLFSSSADCNTYTASSTAYIHASVQ